eukprot:338467-Heterocapsa_arctica.AAC.1
MAAGVGARAGLPAPSGVRPRVPWVAPPPTAAWGVIGAALPGGIPGLPDPLGASAAPCPGA